MTVFKEVSLTLLVRCFDISAKWENVEADEELIYTTIMFPSGMCWESVTNSYQNTRKVRSCCWIMATTFEIQDGGAWRFSNTFRNYLFSVVLQDGLWSDLHDY